MKNKNDMDVVILELKTIGNWKKLIAKCIVAASIGSIIGSIIGLIIRKIIN